MIRTPFIWADTSECGPTPAATDALCGTLDLARSVLDRAGIEPNTGMQGQTIVDILRTDSQGVGALLIEDEGQRTYMGYASPPRLRSLISKGWRLTIAHNTEWGELYDMGNDPHEMNNLWDEPAHAGTKTDLLFRMAQTQAELADASPWPTALA